MQPNEWARRNIFPCHNILFSINDRRTSIYILRGRTRRKNYELLYERQQLSLDSYYPAHSRNVRKRILVTSVLRLRLARACRTCLLHVQKRYALLALRKRRLRLLQRLTPKFESDSVKYPPAFRQGDFYWKKFIRQDISMRCISSKNNRYA